MPSTTPFVIAKAPKLPELHKHRERQHISSVMASVSSRQANGEGVNETGSGTCQYLAGFGNTFESEALPGALPKGQNNPQRCPYQLYAEQLSGSAFTKPRAGNVRSWLYRTRPAVQHTSYRPLLHEGLVGDFGSGSKTCFDPNQMRWSEY